MELEHYGIDGQKWGIRRFQYEDGTLTPEGKERYSRHYSGSIKKSERVALQKDYYNAAHKMSYDDLKSIVDRMQLEKRYRELTGLIDVSKTRGEIIADKIINKFEDETINTVFKGTKKASSFLAKKAINAYLKSRGKSSDN